MDASALPPGPPRLSASKSDALQIDGDGDGDVDWGDTLRYTVGIANLSAADALDVVFSDTPDANAPLIAGTVMTTQGNVTTGNVVGDASVEVDIGTIAANASVSVTFDVAGADPLPVGVSTVSNQGLVTHSASTGVQIDDPDTLENLGDATVTNVELPTCEEDLASCESDLGTCESGLGTCTSDLSTCQDDLEACLNNPPLEDADGDGEHDFTDACPGTPPGGPVDQGGCSQAQFCAGLAVPAACNNGDWKSDEPLEDALDRKAHSGVCGPR